MRMIWILPAALALTSCGGGEADTEALTAADMQGRTPASSVDFGTDDGAWANDGECDDPRFRGPGMTETPLLDSDIRNDATDCREAYERGELTLIE